MDEHILELIPAYSLNSLDRDEQLIAEKHINECEFCRAELQAYNEVVGELAYAVNPVDPPENLKKQVMDRVQIKDVDDRKDISESWWQRFINFTRNASPVWAVASVLLIIFLGASNLFMQSRLNNLSQERVPVNLPVINLNGTDTTPDAIGVIVVSADGEYGTLIVDRLPILEESMQYQLWLIKDGERVSGGVFSVSEDGYGSIWVESRVPLMSYTAFGITREPFGGSPYPTGDKVLGSNELPGSTEGSGSDI